MISKDHQVLFFLLNEAEAPRSATRNFIKLQVRLVFVKRMKLMQRLFSVQI